MSSSKSHSSASSSSASSSSAAGSQASSQEKSPSPPSKASAASETSSAKNEAAPAPVAKVTTPSPAPSTGAPVVTKNGPKITAGADALKGTRPTMEDAHTVIDKITIEGIPPEKRLGFFGVYDGHGGRRCADLTKKYLHECILRDKMFSDGTTGGEHSDEEMFECLKRGFNRTDKIITDIARIEKWGDGCTVASALIYGDRVYVGNLGDAEIIIVRKPAAGAGAAGEATGKCLTYRHKPSSPEERKRIEEAGGHVVFGRVMGTLAVSRAFGDFEFKVPSNKSKADYVSSEPYLAVEELTGDEVALVVACDGVWDVMKYDEAAKLVYEQMTKFKKTPGEAAHALVTRALEKSSSDNVSAIVAYLQWE